MLSALGVALAGMVGSLVLLDTAHAETAHAETAPAVAQITQGPIIQVTAVQARESGKCDPRLVSLRPRLRKLAGYRSYRFVGEERRRLAWRSTGSFELPDGRSLVLLPKGMSDDQVMLQVRLLDGRRRLLDTNVRLRNGSTMVFGFGKDGRSGDEALLILLKAEQ